MHFLEGHFDTALGSLLHYLVPEHSYKSVHDCFNPQLFHAALTAMSIFGYLDCTMCPSWSPILNLFSVLPAWLTRRRVPMLALLS
jgi:hypothetical protein